MRVYSYIVTHDTGFAPNPFHGHLTLACCKPKVRLSAQVGDWIVGLSSGGVRVIYAMRVAERLSFTDYWFDPRFTAKRPNRISPSGSARRGDRIYEPVGVGTFLQQPSAHSHPDDAEDPASKAHDLGGRHVLVADEFVYFGGDGPPLPPELAFLKVGRAHRCRFTQEQVATFARWVAGQPRGVLGHPTSWPAGDESWRVRA